MTSQSTDIPIEELKRAQAMKASRTMLLMQWPAYTVLGLLGILLPVFGTVDEVAYLGTILFITALVQILILIKYGINPGFFWRLFVTIITIVTSSLLLSNAFVDHFTTAQILGGYLAGTGGYIVIEGRYSFSSRHIESVVYCGYFAGVMGIMLFTGWPDLHWWTPTLALSLFLLALGQSARVFIIKEDKI